MGRESRVEGGGSRVEGGGSRVEGLGLRVEGRGFRVQTKKSLGGVPRGQEMLKGHLPGVIHHQVY